MVGKEQIICVRNMELICELVVAIFLGTRDRGRSCPGRRGGLGGIMNRDWKEIGVGA